MYAHGYLYSCVCQFEHICDPEHVAIKGQPSYEYDYNRRYSIWFYVVSCNFNPGLHADVPMFY